MNSDTASLKEKNKNITVSPLYYSVIKEMNFAENKGRNLYYGRGKHLARSFNFYKDEGFHFYQGSIHLFFPELLLLRRQKKIVEIAKSEEYVDFFPYFVKLENQKDDELLFALTVLCLQEDAFIYRLMADTIKK